MLAITDVSFAYEDRLVLRHVNFVLGAGEVIHLLGQNGSGKTTLMKLISNLYPVSFGDITYTQPQFFQEKVAFFSVDMGFHPELTVRQNIEFFPKTLMNAHIEEDLEYLQLLHQYDNVFSHLSLGQQQKIALVVLKQLDAALWLLDEPFANLDKQGENWLWSAINSHAKKGGAVIFTAHQVPTQMGLKTWQLA